MNKAIKTIINSTLKVNYQRELVETGPCQLHVIHNSFRKGVEGYGSEVENFCIDIHVKQLRSGEDPELRNTLKNASYRGGQAAN